MAGPQPIDSQLLQRVKDILRRDLKLGPDATMADDMPLFNGSADLDSLDLLLVVSSLERELGVKIPSASLGESTFRTVETLARFVQDHRGTPVATGTGRAAGRPARPAAARRSVPVRVPRRGRVG